MVSPNNHKIIYYIKKIKREMHNYFVDFIFLFLFPQTMIQSEELVKIEK